jgi:hypothetical protein
MIVGERVDKEPTGSRRRQSESKTAILSGVIRTGREHLAVNNIPI